MRLRSTQGQLTVPHCRLTGVQTFDSSPYCKNSTPIPNARFVPILTFKSNTESKCSIRPHTVLQIQHRVQMLDSPPLCPSNSTPSPNDRFVPMLSFKIQHRVQMIDSSPCCPSKFSTDSKCSIRPHDVLQNSTPSPNARFNAVLRTPSPPFSFLSFFLSFSRSLTWHHRSE